VLDIEQPSALRRLIQERLQGTAPHAEFVSAGAASSVNALVRRHLPADPIAGQRIYVITRAK
jgi:hypothetical protein